MSEAINHQHNGTTNIKSRALALGQVSYEELRQKIPKYKWQEIYKSIKNNAPEGVRITDKMLCKFCDVSRRTVVTWKDKIPVKQIYFMNLLLAFGYCGQSPKIEYLFSRLAHKSNPLVLNDIESIAFRYINTNHYYEYQTVILPMLQRGEESPLFTYIKLLEEYISSKQKSDRRNAWHFISNDSKAKESIAKIPDQKSELAHYLEEGYDDYRHLIDFSNELTETIKRKLEDFPRQKGKKISADKIITQRIPSLKYDWPRFKHNHGTLSRLQLIKLGLAFTMTFDEINRLLTIAGMDPLAYKNGDTESMLIEILGRLEQLGVLRPYMTMNDIEDACNSVFASFGAEASQKKRKFLDLYFNDINFE